jgi:ABC-2 type transport system ATP-binding protein
VVVQVQQLRKTYGDRTVVDGVSFDVAEGEIFGILGPNGAGKTTTVECIAGLRVPDGGSVQVLGLDPQRDGVQLRRRLGIQLQESRLQDKLRVWEALDLYASFYPEPADPGELLELLDLTSHRKVAYGALSGGQKQRLSIALALVGRPEVAILDELTTGLDPGARRDTWELVERVRDTGVTVLLVTHLMEEAQRLCHRLAVIDRGRIVGLDTPEGLVAQVADEQRLRFVPSVPLDDGLLTSLDGVVGVERDGREVLVTGTGDVVQTVIAVLAREGIVAGGLRVEQRTLDDAFVALTGRRLAPDTDQEVAR